MPNPPAGVKLTMQAACVMFEVKPILKDDPTYAGRKIKDWWATAQRFLLAGKQASSATCVIVPSR